MEYRFEELQPLKFAVYDVDNESLTLEDDDFLGQVEVSLGNIVSVGSTTLKLQHKSATGEGKGDLGTITVLIAHMCDCVINPRRACAARVTVLGLCVCLSVRLYSRTTGNDAAYERYQQL